MQSTNVHLINLGVDMKIELKNIRYAKFASQETNCYRAAIYIDGKRAGDVHNDGQGGCDHVHPYSVQMKIDEYAATLPEKDGFPQDHETICGDLFLDWLTEKDLTRLLKTNIVFTRDEGIFTLKSKPELNLSITELAERLKATEILNLMPFADAIKLYRSKT